MLDAAGTTEPRANLNVVSGRERNPPFGDGLRARLERARRERKLSPAEGKEISADGKELRTPTEAEFFDALEKASAPDEAAPTD